MIPMIRDILSHLPGRGGAPGVAIEAVDVLGRRPVDLDTPQLQAFLAGARVLVTGAGGSIGSEICRQVMRFGPERLLLAERAENPLFEIDRELNQRWAGADIRPYVADICDRARIEDLFHAERPDVVFHCAAHKHVPMMERNVGEAVKNNVFGTQVVADAAAKAGVEAFVLISSDKAVNPSSVMGASKRCAELYVQGMNFQGDEATKGQSDEGEENVIPLPFVASSLPRSVALPSRFLSVRFGNVLGSSGSVVPIFARQIAAGGPVTVTHPGMRRYFMTIPEAAQLVMQAGAIGRGGEVFVLDMGKPVRIVDLARAMIRQRGLRPGKDISIVFTGVRPGEKLYEELSCENEQIAPTSHPGICVWKLPAPDRRQVERMMGDLASAAGGSDEAARAALRRAVAEYRPAEGAQTMARDKAA
jgi:FlaA1/EpsC-like NDP-sugar epimerase